MRQVLNDILARTGLSVREDECSGYEGDGIKLSVSGMCSNGIDDFYVATLPYPTREAAEEALESALLAFVDPKAFPKPGVPGLFAASSAEELALKSEASA